MLIDVEPSRGHRRAASAPVTWRYIHVFAPLIDVNGGSGLGGGITRVANVKANFDKMAATFFGILWGWRDTEILAH